MGQAASMCRFRGCRYKKNKSNKTAPPPATPPPAATTTPLSLSSLPSTPTATVTTEATTTLTVASTCCNNVVATTAILPETTTIINMSPQQTTTTQPPPQPPHSGLQLRSIEEPSSALQTRMSAEQGGTGYCVTENGLWISQRGIGVPLPLSQQNATHLHQQQQQHHHHQTQTQATTAQNQQQLLHHQHQQQQQQQQQHYQQQLQFQHNYHLHQQQQQFYQAHKAYDAEYARMESWLDENQEFVQDYFIRKATRQTVDAWLVSHATTAGNDLCSQSPTHANGPNCSSRGGSGATTPVRKISAHEFERGGLLKPIVNTIDGTPTFLSIGPQMEPSNGSGGGGTGNSNASSNQNYGSSQYHQYHPSYQNHYQQQQQQQSGSNVGGTNNCSSSGVAVVGNGGGIGGSAGSNAVAQHNYHNQYHHNYYHHRPQRLSRNELKQLDEKELIFELVKDICNELEVRTLCHKILQNVSILLNADRGSLFLVQGRCNGADGLKKCLVSKLFDVCPRSTVEEMEQQEEVRVAWGTGIAGHVAESGEPVNIPDAYQDERFNCEIDTLTGYRTKALLCMPIKDSSGDVIGVAQVINKLNGECFTEIDEKVFSSYLQFCGIGLRNAQLFEKSQLEIKRNQVLLDLARMIFEEQSTIEHMVFRILTHMQSLIQCQRVQILLVHEASKGSFSRVFDFEANDLSEEEAQSRTSPYESRFPINIGITGHVATTGETVTIPNAYEDDRFDPSVDDASCFKHRSILCMAIKNSLGQIIGVIQLINKFNELDFTKNDENFVEAFAIFCGMGIHNTHMYEKAVVAMAKQSVTLEVLSYHASATMDEAHRLRRLRVPSAAHFCLHDFKFDDIHFEDDDTLKACLRMFLDLDFVERFHIDYEVLCRWLLSVKKNYRNVTYHNWRHAFNVAQMMFAILTTTQWWKIFGEIECLALIIGCLCHDLDHRGTNNSFQIKASSPLAQLYSTSTMEHHHFDQCLMILNSPGNQILANLSSDDYCRVIRVLEDAILSTDLAVYFRKRGPFLESVEQPMTYWVAEEPRALLRAMSMTVCDLSAITKPWDIEKRVADLVSSEFFEQGDMEKQELNITPIDIMNREKEDELPTMQVNFIDSICMPIYEAFATLSDKLEPLVEGVRDNRKHWIDLAVNVQEVPAEEEQSAKQATTNLVISNGNGNNMLNGKVESSTDTERDVCADESANDDDDADDADDGKGHDTTNEDHGIEADDDDSEVEAYHSNGCYSASLTSSSGSSRVSTPPPTGEDDSTPTSPAKTTATTQAKLIAENLNALNRRKSRHVSGCKSCEYARNQNVRKASSLKETNELKAIATHLTNGKCNAHAQAHSRSTPTMTNLGQHHAQHSIAQHHQHHSHSHHHHHHHHHSHHNHGQHHQHQHQHTTGIGSASIGGSGVIGLANASNSAAILGSTPESDKIPKIVGKLGNLDAVVATVTNGGIGFQPNGHFSNFVPSTTTSSSSSTAAAAATATTTTTGHVLTRRHSETHTNVSVSGDGGGGETSPSVAVAIMAEK